MSAQECYPELERFESGTNEGLTLVAHEMRSPLAAIANAVNVLDRLADGDDRSSKLRQLIRRQTGVLDRMVRDLLEASCISRGVLKLSMQNVELKLIVERAVETTEQLMKSARHQFAVSLDPSLAVIYGDDVRLEQVLVNLLTNAAKFTGPGGHIRLNAVTERDEVVIRVIDDGIGIEPEMLPRVFNLFTQAKPVTEIPSVGLGIGLALVRAIVEKHGGTILVESSGIGRGSEFTVRLPANCKRHACAPAARAEANLAMPQF